MTTTLPQQRRPPVVVLLLPLLMLLLLISFTTVALAQVSPPAPPSPTFQQPSPPEHNPDPEPGSGGCFKVGCHHELCMDDPNIKSSCGLQRPDFHCYFTHGDCGRHGHGGSCNWKLTPELIDCVTAANADPVGECHVVGCHKELCMSDASITSDCNLQRPDFHCYQQFGQCGHHDAGGACNWKLTPELIDCVNAANAGGNPSSSPRPNPPQQQTTRGPTSPTTRGPSSATQAPPSPPASTADCYTSNVQAASTICGMNLLNLDFASMNYESFRGMCASCLEPILFTQSGPCRAYDDLQSTLHVECDVCLGKRSQQVCERDPRCFWNAGLDRCAIQRPFTNPPSRAACYNTNLQAAADECGRPLVTTNFQTLGTNEFQAVCTACLNVILNTQPETNCASYDDLQASFRIECNDCITLNSQGSCESSAQCIWLPDAQRCGMFRREDLSREADPLAQCNSNNPCSDASHRGHLFFLSSSLMLLALYTLLLLAAAAVL